MSRLTQAETTSSRTRAIEEVRRLKRAVMLGVYGAIFGSVAIYAFLLDFSPMQLITNTALTVGIAVCANEGAFSRM
ncbi:MAG: hypothetical protein AAB092_07810, partial [Chloroflexota bacterium]